MVGDKNGLKKSVIFLDSSVGRANNVLYTKELRGKTSNRRLISSQDPHIPP